MLIYLILGSILLASLIIFYCEYVKFDKQKAIKKISNRVKKLSQEKNHQQDYFAKYPKFYINLDRNNNRNSLLLDQFETYKIENFKRVKAYDYKEFEKMIEKPYIINKNKIDNLYELAITMSHCKAILNVPNIGGIVMEDDINFCTISHWEKDFKYIISNLPDDCDILLLSNNSIEEKQTIKKLKVGDRKIANGVCYFATKMARDKIKNNFIIDGKFNFETISSKITFDTYFLDNFNVYYLTQSLFIPETYILHENSYDFNLDRKNFHSPSEKISNYYSHKIIK